ncbi:cell surface protein SprA [Hymenobacter sp. BT559]|nr:cell surface protein SprA [Hymenobacter sp. BT559]
MAAAWAGSAGAAGHSRVAVGVFTWAGQLGLPMQGLPTQTVPADTGRYRPSRRPRVRTQDRPGSRFSPQRRRSPLVLPLPKSVQVKVTPDDSLKRYDVRETVGTDIDYRDPTEITREELLRFQERQAINDYYRLRSQGGVAGTGAQPGSAQAQRLIPKIDIGPVADRIFGGRYIDIRPAGSLTLKAGARFNTNRNPALTLRQQSVGDFIFEQNMNLNLSGTVGTKLKLTFNYDTKAAFDFDNQMKFDYVGQPTDILRKLDLGNVSMPLNNSLITGGSNLFGIKTQLQFGRLGVTAVAATLRGSADEVRVQNGAQSRTYELKASQYERDRHFFLAQYFRDQYDQNLRGLPTVQSGITITRLEVYVTNDNRTTDNLRNVVALMDLGEPRRDRTLRSQFFNQTVGGAPFARNPGNSLYNALLNGGAAARDNLNVEQYLGSLPTPQGTVALIKNLDYERVRARKLAPSEYTFNPQLGYINLNTALLPDQVLGVSYSYIYNGTTYTVGETINEYSNVAQDQVIFLKLLKATNPGVGTVAYDDRSLNFNQFNPNLRTRNTPAWDLMMKNIYSLNASQLNRDNFNLQIIYKDDATGVDLISLKEGARIQNTPLIQVLGLDRVNANNDRNADGNFDFFPGITIDPELGKIIFPSVQPFGSYLRAQFDTANTNATIAASERALVQKYVYQALYTQTQSDAQQQQVKDKFFLRGRFQGAAGSDEISLPGIGVAQGSVKVYSGSTLLTEGVDYQVFYDQAKVKVLNPAYLSAANELRVAFEKNALVQVQPRKLVGTRLDYAANKDALFGFTAMHILENQAPGINRVNIGDEPANNTMLGGDVSFRKDSRVLTKLVDMLPIVSTKEISTVAFTGEVAKLIAGRAQLGRGENGVSYIDDFENARTPYTLGGLASVPAWRLAATPAPILGSATGLASNYQRGKLAWYTIDQSYYTGGNGTSGIAAATLSNFYTRGIPRNEIFPNKDLGATGNGYEYSFDLAYYPSERGPYNFSTGLDAGDRTGRRFANTTPAANASRFGGISRGITFDTDFDNANIEYLEFWMLDPFAKASNRELTRIDDPASSTPYYADTNPGGRFILNLGNVSEDALKDGNRHEFENGLPTPADPDPAQNTEPTAWGRVTTQQFLTDAFNAAAGARALQDVGLDGFGNVDEKVFWNGKPGGFDAFDDPAADDFRHHLDPFYTQNNVQLLGRYKDYDNYEGNSPENSQLSSTAYPDKEDLNRDNVVQDSEQYYEYSMELRPGRLNIGENYIIDKVEAPVTNTTGTITGETVTYYQFRIPVREYTGIQGNRGANDFKNIRFMRMYLTGWQQPVVLRMVQPQFVANQWRRFLSRISDPSVGLTSQITDARAFNVSTVSVEENGLTTAASSGAIPYVQPPGITRDIEYGSSSVSRQQNEQSLRLCVEELRDGYGKAAYKNISINMLRYKRLRMYLHADSQDPNTLSSMQEGDSVRAFLRIGTDYTQNYYEYSLPLTFTTAGQTAQTDVWPESNNVDIAFQDFIDAKAERNQRGWPLTLPYIKKVLLPSGKTAYITILGNPDFSAVQGCMIGVLNPVKAGNTSSKTFCLWADEFRVFDFENQGGWAANARLNVKLADLANITATGSFVGVGFGGLQDKAQARSTNDIVRGDLNATVAVDKFLPPALRLKVPVLVQASTQVSTPQYDPLDPDTKLEQSLLKFQTAEAKAEYKQLVVDRTTSRSISVLNVRKERAPSQTKVRPWDIENVAVSYAITERTHSDINTQRDYSRSYTAALAYIYQTTPRSFTPLSTIKALDNPYLKIFKEVNFTPLPSRFSFRTDLDRRYNERFLQRVLEPGTLPTTGGIPGVFYKSFYINRVYDLRWDITKALAIDYTANNRGVIDEGIGRSIGDSPEARANREQQWKNLLRGGRTTNFDQTISATYRLPLDKFPLTDWLSADVRYSAHYTWQAASTALRARTPTPMRFADGTIDPTDTATVAINLGNTVQNNAEFTANGKIDLVKLYNKVRFLNIINNAQPAPRPRPAQPVAGAPVPPGRPQQPVAPDTARKDPLRFVKAALRAIMTARSINFTYAHSNGTLLPGYLPRTRFFGLTDGSFDGLAPGIPFILGQQYSLSSLYQEAVSKGWYTQSSQYLNTAYSALLTDNVAVRTALEPFRGFNIQLDARWQRTKNDESYYRNAIDTSAIAYKEVGYLQPFSDFRQAPVQALGTGSFSATTITIQTFFGDLGANGETSKAFDRFVANRAAVQAKLQAANPARPAVGTTTGLYSLNSQDVLIQSFLDAYHGKSSDGYEAKRFNPFGMFPLPNWRLEYNTFAELPGMRDLFRSFTINHLYSSVYTLGSYTTTTSYSRQPDFGPNALVPLVVNSTGQYVPYYVVGQVSFLESLAPLAGINFQTVNNITGRLQYATSRAVALNTTNAQVTEVHATDLTIGIGYAATGLRLPFRVGGEQRVLKNNLQARLDLSIRDNTTIQRSILNSVDPIPAVLGGAAAVQGDVGIPTSQITNGALTVQLRPTVDYLLNARLNLQFYFTQTITQPRVSNAFRNATTEGGLQLRYSLQ